MLDDLVVGRLLVLGVRALRGGVGEARDVHRRARFVTEVLASISDGGVNVDGIAINPRCPRLYGRRHLIICRSPMIDSARRRRLLGSSASGAISRQIGHGCIELDEQGVDIVGNLIDRHVLQSREDILDPLTVVLIGH